jgi:hypothetical protein
LETRVSVLGTRQRSHPDRAPAFVRGAREASNVPLAEAPGLEQRKSRFGPAGVLLLHARDESDFQLRRTRSELAHAIHCHLRGRGPDLTRRDGAREIRGVAERKARVSFASANLAAKGFEIPSLGRSQR